MTVSHQQDGPPSVAIIGGGPAGLAAAVRLCERGFRVEVFEARAGLGGRAGSFRDSASGERVDYCQHVALGCSTNLADFCRRTSTAECFRRQRRLHFVGPDGREYGLSAARWLPAPLHLVPGLFRLGYLTLADRRRILRTMARLARRPVDPDDRATAGSWLRDQGESDLALRHFWSVILASALGEKLDRVSLAAARKVIVEGFLASRHAHILEIPRVPLDEIFDHRVADWLANRGAAVRRRTPVRELDGDGAAARAVVLSDGSRRPFDFFVVAVPWRRVGRLLPGAMLDVMPALGGLGRIESSPITAVHLWFDRPILRRANAVLVGRLGQWAFRPNAGKTTAVNAGHAAGSPSSHYCQVVISASHELVGRDPENVAGRVIEELRSVWPAARRATLLRHRVVTVRQAVFSPRPGVERFRPPQKTPIANLALAGDWTDTGWPATLEGAVRSGYLAAEAILREAFPGRSDRLVAPDLPYGPLARRLIRGLSRFSENGTVPFRDRASA